MTEKPKQTHKFMRIYRELEPEEIKKKLMIIEDLYGACASCGQLGLTFTKNKTCPGCNATFAYVMTKLKNPADIHKILARIKAEGLSLVMIEKDDYERTSARDAVGDLFSKPAQ